MSVCGTKITTFCFSLRNYNFVILLDLFLRLLLMPRKQKKKEQSENFFFNINKQWIWFKWQKKVEPDGTEGIGPPWRFLLPSCSALFFSLSFDTSTLVTDLLSIFSSHQSSSELSTSVGSSALCHPPPPCFSSSFPPPPVLPVFLPPPRLFESIKFTGDKTGTQTGRKRLISEIRKRMRVECQAWKQPGKVTYLSCRISFISFPSLISHLQKCRM